MRIFKCRKCGCVIPKNKLVDNLKRLGEEGLISKKTQREALQELKKRKPHISCHNPVCDGLLRETDSDSIQTRFQNKEQDTKNG